MPQAIKYQIPAADLDTMTVPELSAKYRISRSAARSRKENRGRTPPVVGIVAGWGGDREFDRLMGEHRFTECPRAIRDVGSRERLSAPSIQYSSYSGCAASLACV